METVQEYVESFTGVQREWLDKFMSYMREHYPDFRETLSYQIPMFRFDRQYVAFSLAKTHFSLHTLDLEMIEMAEEWLPKAQFGKGCVKVKYTNEDAIPTLFKVIDTIVERHLAEGRIQG